MDLFYLFVFAHHLENVRYMVRSALPRRRARLLPHRLAEPFACGVQHRRIEFPAVVMVLKEILSTHALPV
ncbi:hypothetical protein [Burkholderia sp. A9]|uniref:hypothetical protein n=1 Tax=Burkholderia sp. A9 TaxID=1365108 RepID=UPI00058061F4|nr:hypothetical protein [Burkholderia sp. A9]